MASATARVKGLSPRARWRPPGGSRAGSHERGHRLAHVVGRQLAARVAAKNGVVGGGAKCRVEPARDVAGRIGHDAHVRETGPDDVGHFGRFRAVGDDDLDGAAVILGQDRFQRPRQVHGFAARRDDDRDRRGGVHGRRRSHFLDPVPDRIPARRGAAGAAARRPAIRRTASSGDFQAYRSARAHAPRR